MTEYIDKTEAMRRFKPFGREIPKEQVMAVLARIEALKREPSEDGTLEVKVEDATKIGRVLISDDEHRGGLYYPDEDEPQSDLISRAEALMEARPEYLSPEQIGHEEYNKGWNDAISMYWDNLNALPAKTQDRPTDSDFISRAEAIEAIEIVDWYHQNQNKDMVHGANDDEHQAWYKAQDIYEALEAVPQSVSFENDTKIKSCSKDSDLISREAAKDIAFRSPFFSDALIEELDALPSADRPTDSDIISRADAIEALGEEPPVWCDDDAEIAERSQWRADIEAIKSVPSAARPRGEWKQIEINGYPYAVCDQCHLLADIVEKDGELVMSMANADEKCANFCPNCGADMRGDTE